MATINKIENSDNYRNSVDRNSVELVDKQSQKDLEAFKNYYENAPEGEKEALNNKFKTYVAEELQKDPKLKDKLSGSETMISPEIDEAAIADLNTVIDLTDVLDNYPNISSPEYRAVKKMVDEYTNDLTTETQEVLANKEYNEEGKKVDNYN